jgi:hypothetical protein
MTMPKLHAIAIEDLRPTQITVGMVEVREKKKHIEKVAQHPHHLAEFVAEHAIPVVAGRKGRFHLIDHHHLARALWEAGVPQGDFDVVSDLSNLDADAFWQEMERQAWVHPYDEHGRKQPVDGIPHHVSALKDDPYRSLAAYVRNAGGYQKTPTPFAEFLWADYFRTRMPLADLTDHFERAVGEALALARQPAAAHLPGYGTG